MNKNIKTYNNLKFAHNLRILMSTKNIGLKEISKLTGCAVSTASTWRRGRVPKDKNIIKKLAKYFDTDVKYLLGNQQNQPIVFANQAENIDEISKIECEITKHINRLMRLTNKDIKKLKKLKTEIKTKIPIEKF